MRMLLLILLLSACTEQRSITDPWTGAVTDLSPDYEVFRQDQGRMSVRAARVVLSGQEQWGLLTSVRRTGPNGPRVQRVQSGEIDLQYTRLDRLFTHCIDQCQRTEIGFILLSPEVFFIAAKNGLSIRVWGSRGRYWGTVPAEAFAYLLGPDA